METWRWRHVSVTEVRQVMWERRGNGSFQTRSTFTLTCCRWKKGLEVDNGSNQNGKSRSESENSFSPHGWNFLPVAKCNRKKRWKEKPNKVKLKAALTDMRAYGLVARHAATTHTHNQSYTYASPRTTDRVRALMKAFIMCIWPLLRASRRLMIPISTALNSDTKESHRKSLAADCAN